MKTPVTRPATIQELLRNFAAGNPPGRPEQLRYLAAPFYKVTGDGGTITMAGDGRAFIWTKRRVPGFRDYIVPPAGVGYVDIPSVLAKFMGAPQTELPGLDGPSGPRAVQEIRLSHGRAIIRRTDLERLLMLDTCRISGGSEFFHRAAWENGGAKWIVFAGNFAEFAVCGVVFCQEPRTPRLKRKPSTAAAVARS